MHSISVSIVYATRERQWLSEHRVRRGTSAGDYLRQCGLLDEVPDLQDQRPESLELGVYGERVDHDHLLEQGDRVEIYRPLLADPKEVRRQLALLGKTIGNKGNKPAK